MSEKINESAAAGSIGAHSIAVSHDRLGGMRTRMSLKDFMHKFHSGLTNRYKFHAVNMEGSIKSITESSRFPYQVDDAVSRLKGMETIANRPETDIITYGVEDDAKVMMKITVPIEQSEDFERQVAQALADVLDYKKTGKGEDKSLAELLYELKDQFTIISVEFPTIPKDAVYNADEVTEGLPEEDDLDDVDDTEGLDDEFGDEEEFDSEDEELGDEFEGGDSKEDLLNSVLGMLKAQNEKEVAQANAEAEKAKAKQAELALQASNHEMQRAEEAVASQAEMEAEKDKEKQAKGMAEIAKFNYKKRMGENAGFSLMFREVLLELDTNDTVQSLRRQMSIIPMRYRGEPDDDVETKRFNSGQQRLAMRELRVKMRAARERENYDRGEDEKDRDREEAEPENPQDPQNNQVRTNDRG